VGACDNPIVSPRASRYGDYTLSEFTAVLATAEPIPGGGSAAAVAASIAASLVVMVARLSLDRPKYAAFDATHQRAIQSGEAARTRFLELADADADAYATFSAALKLPRESPEEQTARAQSIDSAAREAAQVPLEVVRQCQGLIELAESMAGRSNLNASSDLDVAALLAQAAARGAAANVLVNVSSIADARVSGSMLSELEGLLHDIEGVAASVHRQVRGHSLRQPEAR
jgi:formiminotetrahydrofolate cyclodeaminase